MREGGRLGNVENVKGGGRKCRKLTTDGLNLLSEKVRLGDDGRRGWRSP